jgi:hypothetical protein
MQCKQHFYLRYVKKLTWPAPVTEPILLREQQLENGNNFHLLIQQYIAGIPAMELSRTILDENLQHWWQNFLQYDPMKDMEGKKLAEYTLSTRLAGYHLDAKFDLLVIHPDSSITIFDWKTNQFRPSFINLEKNLQTQVYRYVLASTGSSLLPAGNFQPENIRMTYWYVEFPDTPISFNYSSITMRNEQNHLASLIEEITHLSEDAFERTEKEKYCQVCTYRSLCDRGITAGIMDEETSFDDASDDIFSDLDIDQIGEIIH